MARHRSLSVRPTFPAGGRCGRCARHRGGYGSASGTPALDRGPALHGRQLDLPPGPRPA
ncbi:hypothetical protein ACFFX0_24395 [Citricoccus parietis]|uniref:Uncharacterized protein n=1 Tax=Citricoccus parietis TaxID=592307 RepID=A0ABV5G6B3_9MICC